MASDPADAVRLLLAQTGSRILDLRETLETQAAAIEGAEFDPSTGAPGNLAGQWVSNLSLVADELGEVLATLRRLEPRTGSTAGPPSSIHQLRPRPLVWEWKIDEERFQLEDPAGHWHARVWQEEEAWRWELAPGYDYGEAQAIADPELDGEKVASEACERVLALHGWPPVCLPSGAGLEGLPPLALSVP